jgi:hypothetical protein
MIVHRTKLAVAAGIVFMVLPIAAHAQTSGTDAPRPQAAPAAPTAPAAPAAPPNADEDAAIRFKRGLKLFDDGDYALALVEFERAYSLAPNYRALYNVALVNAQLGRYAAATRAFEQYLHDGGDGVAAERQAQVRSRLADLKLRTATLDVSINAPGAEILLDGKPLEASQLHGPVLIDAGEHTLRASAPGYEPGLRTLTLAGADASVVHFDLVATKRATPTLTTSDRRHLFVPGVVATGVFAAGAIGSGIVMLSARGHLTSLQNTPGSTSQSRSSAASEANTAGIIADVCTGLAVVSGGLSLYLSLQVGSSPKAPEISISPNHVLFSGTF